MKFIRLAFLASAMVSACAFGQRAPNVSYTVAGSSGNWTLDFTVTSTFLPGEGNFYFFGVVLGSGRNIAGSPSGWDPNTWTSWNNSAFGGSSTVYNNNWIDLTFGTGAPSIAPGETLSGFQAISSDSVAPTSVNWFAYASEGTYTGTGNFNTATNPGFEGTATVVPEPATMAILGLGAAALASRRRRAR